MLQRKNKTRAELSEFCGISRETIYQSAASKNGLNAKVLLNIAEFLHCPVDYLLGREGYVYDLEKNEVVLKNIKARPQLPREEVELLKLFRQLPELEKYKMLGRLEVLAEQSQPKQETV
jgi:transcriptional regulator with XRE-family HTH domain